MRSSQTKRVLALFTLPIAASILLAACATPADTSDDRGSSSSSNDEDEEDEEDSGPAAPERGEIAEPGTTVGVDEWLSYPFTGTDGQEAVVSARLLSVEPATAEERAVLDENFGDQIADYDIYLVRYEQEKESGDPIEFDSDYSYFDVVDADGERVQPISLIGWDACDTQSFDSEFDTAGGTLQQCAVGGVPTGDDAPAGLAYTGGYEDDNPYDYIDGEPLLFLKK